jgi:hypothetical protein
MMMIGRFAFPALIIVAGIASVASGAGRTEAAGFRIRDLAIAPVITQTQAKEGQSKPATKPKPKPKSDGGPKARKDGEEGEQRPGDRFYRGTICDSPGRPPCPNQ